MKGERKKKEREKKKYEERNRKGKKQIFVTAAPVLELISSYSYRRASAG